jgi:nucleotide sugar dehydrogenase
MIGIIGYGMVGKAVEYGFSKTTAIISDPQYNSTTVADVVAANPDAIFVCVPTPTDSTNYIVLTSILDTISVLGYKGITVVKSTVLPQYLKRFDVVYNPEFLSRATSFEDFVDPPMLLIGGDRGFELLQLYEKDSIVDTPYKFLLDIPTTAFIKYTMNTFYALKVTFMNEMSDVADRMGANYETAATILAHHPWMGTHHFHVPGPDGKRGFGGPCLPKDTQAIVKEYDVELLKLALTLNDKYRNL